MYGIIFLTYVTERSRKMKHHKYWAMCTMFCFLMTMYTGHKHI